jgi:hypothetical protein
VTVLSFRTFKVPQVTETKFFQSVEKANEDFARDDLKRSGLDLTDLGAYTHPMLRLPEKAQAGYVIPYFGLDGNPIVDGQNNLIMHRTRLKYPEFAKESRYTQPSGEQLVKHGLPSYLPYFHPLSFSNQGDVFVCCEGEKKTVSVLKYLGLPAFGIGGCQMWRDPGGSGAIHPWIKRLFQQRGIQKLLIIPDADVFRYDICNAYGTFAAAAETEGLAVEIANPQGKIDDLIVSWGKDALELFGALPRIASKDLVQSPNSLIKRFNLAFRVDAKDRPIVHQHTSNIMRLMEEHSAFPKVWRNLDNNRVMIGDNAAQPDLTEMDIANYFQHNLGFDKVGHKTIYSCIQALCKRNARSPMLEYIKGLSWDGEPRLDTWAIRHWGVKDTEFNREAMSKWMIASCARMDKPGTKVDWMLIVTGPQGTGKTSMPSILFKENNLVLYGEHSDKDFHMLLHSSLCVGFDELDNFGKKETTFLKAMISRCEDAFRPPYGPSVEVFPRRFTLYGSGNRHEFLQHDPSGYRRYAVLEAGRKLDFGGLDAERDHLWAESWARYVQGCDYFELAGASEQAERFVVPNPIEDQIINWIEMQKTNKSGTNVKDGFLYFTMTQLLMGINRERDLSNSFAIREVAAVLHKLGCEQKSSQGSPVPGVYGRYYQVSTS